MITRYMLDTNIVSGLLRGHEEIASRVVATPMASLCISAITLGELKFGLAKRPAAKRLHSAVEELLLRIESLPWDNAVAARYGTLRAEMVAKGKVLATLDMLTASHAVATGAILVSQDASFRQVSGLMLEDWTAP
jgi:tRNA(fMet)-specific endonuclease VapC